MTEIGQWPPTAWLKSLGTKVHGSAGPMEVLQVTPIAEVGACSLKRFDFKGLWSGERLLSEPCVSNDAKHLMIITNKGRLIYRYWSSSAEEWKWHIFGKAPGNQV